MERTDSSRPPVAEQRGLFALFHDLVEGSAELTLNAARMAASEGRVVLHRLVVRLAAFVAGLFVAAMGLLLVLLGAALLLARAASIEPWLAYVLVGAVAMTAGALFAARALRRISEADIAFPATLAEFEADAEMLRAGKVAP